MDVYAKDNNIEDRRIRGGFFAIYRHRYRTSNAHEVGALKMAITHLMETVWKSKNRNFKSLGTDITCDVAVIGGGMAGLWCAYHLVRAGKKVCVLEAKSIGSGVTSGSTAILTYAQDIIYKPLIKKHGKEVAREYLKDSVQAISEIKKLIETEKIECDLEPIKFILFSAKRKGKRALVKEQEAYKKLNKTISRIDPGLPYKTRCALEFNDCYQFDPLKLCDWLSDYVTRNGGTVYENTLVADAPDGTRLKVGGQTVTAESFIVATHFPFINVPGFYWLKMYQEQNYAIAFKGGDKNFAKGISYESIDKTGYEYRRVGENILVDGVSVRTGKKPYKSKYRILEAHIAKYFGKVEETARFSAQDCITLDKLPYAGKYSHFADNVFVVTGFNKWGMTNSYITAKVASDMVLGKKNIDSRQNIYSPQRVALFINPVETITHVGEVVAAFANDLLNVDAKKFDRIGPGQGAIIKYKGHRVGASRDDKGKVHLVSGICPHMGCSLKWNKDDRSFDCPCHGSRFDTKGGIINGPATKSCSVLAKKIASSCDTCPKRDSCDSRSAEVS